MEMINSSKPLEKAKSKLDYSFVPRLGEISFETARSSGKGGQNVNKRETKVRAFVFLDETNLTNEEKDKTKRLCKDISEEGKIYAVSQEERSQGDNKERAESLLINKVAEILNTDETPRRLTELPRSIKNKNERLRKMEQYRNNRLFSRKSYM